MACIVLKSPFGLRKVVEGTPYRAMKDEQIIGVDWDCEGQEQRDVEAELQRNGIQWGDAIAWVTKKVGIAQCPPCKARQEILNSIGEHGLIDTIRKIKETF